MESATQGPKPVRGELNHMYKNRTKTKVEFNVSFTMAWWWQDPDRPGHLKKEVFEHPEKAWADNKIVIPHYDEYLIGGAFDNSRMVNPNANYELTLTSPPDWMGLRPIKDWIPVPADPDEYARMASALLRLYLTEVITCRRIRRIADSWIRSLLNDKNRGWRSVGDEGR